MKLSHTTYKSLVLLGHIVFFAYAPLLIWLALDAGWPATVYRVTMTLLDPGSRSISLELLFSTIWTPVRLVIVLLITAWWGWGLFRVMRLRSQRTPVAREGEAPAETGYDHDETRRLVIGWIYVLATGVLLTITPEILSNVQAWRARNISIKQADVMAIVSHPRQGRVFQVNGVGRFGGTGKNPGDFYFLDSPDALAPTEGIGHFVRISQETTIAVLCLSTSDLWGQPRWVAWISPDAPAIDRAWLEQQCVNLPQFPPKPGRFYNVTLR